MSRAGVVPRGMSPEQAEALLDPYERIQAPEKHGVGNLGIDHAAKGGPRGNAERGLIREDCAGNAVGHVSHRAWRGREGFKGGTSDEVAGIVFGVPQLAFLFRPVAHSPCPTSSVPIFGLD